MFILLVAAVVTLVAAVLLASYILLLAFTPSPVPAIPSEQHYTDATYPDDPQPLPSLQDPATIALSVIVPAFNEVDRLAAMVDEAVEFLIGPAIEQAKFGKLHVRSDVTELIVVDDGSTDGTSGKALELAKDWSVRDGARNVEIRVITLAKNRGKGGAVQHGMKHARGERVLFADADGASRFADLELLQDAMDQAVASDGHAMVVGSRAHLVNSDAVVKRSLLRNALMHGFHLFLRTLGVDGIRDTQCGFKLFTRPTARLLFPPLHLPHWSFDVELLLLASLCTDPIPIREIAIHWHEVGGSKIRLGWDSIGMARDLLVLRANLALGRWKAPERV